MIYKTFTFSAKEPEVIALKKEEILAIKSLDLSTNKPLEKVRDCFLFLCYTALRYSDAANLKKENVLNETLEYVSIKTKSAVSVPLHPSALEIVKKYEHFDSNTLLPFISNQKMNGHLKEIGKMANLNRDVIKVKYYGALRKEFKRKLHEVLTTHIGRKSFISYLFNQGMDSELIRSFSHEAFAILHERYFGLLYRHAFHRFTAFRSKHEVEDVLQDLFIKLWENRAELDPKASFKAYIYTNLKNRLLNDLAKQKVQQQYLDSLKHLMQQQEDNLTTDYIIREKELIALLEKEVNELPPKMRIAFEMSRNQHLSYEEIATQLNISPHTARTQVRNVLRILKMKFPYFIFSVFF